MPKRRYFGLKRKRSVKQDQVAADLTQELDKQYDWRRKRNPTLPLKSHFKTKALKMDALRNAIIDALSTENQGGAEDSAEEGMDGEEGADDEDGVSRWRTPLDAALPLPNRISIG
ncbi:hypothetical protein M422DRAFT_269352 [Sphaerobolus stellatus SS14]|uniref:Uncharacterized protein n=1 Tax=Sphaerobolus stellatus (strain SS14) TaxID=990650 RepID=A0A0C9UVP8_SPHS4|nr:hypothetical protein M422DRAFT_269352 [Sphaerobolus stellatus SS14]